MRPRRVVQEMIIAVGVAAGVIAVGFIVLLAAGPVLRRPGDIYNLCVLDRAQVFERSAIGRSANSQLMQVKQRDQDAINSEKRMIDQTTIVGTPDARMLRLLQRVQKENARLELLRARARTLVIQRITPTIRREAASSRCSTIVDSSAIVDLGQAKDINLALVKAIDKTVPPLPPGALEHLSGN